MTIAVLAVQGAFIEHEKKLEKLGADCIELRKAENLSQHYDGLVLPGGESTVQGKLLKELGMFDTIKSTDRIRNAGSGYLCGNDSACRKTGRRRGRAFTDHAGDSETKRLRKTAWQLSYRSQTGRNWRNSYDIYPCSICGRSGRWSTDTCESRGKNRGSEI